MWGRRCPAAYSSSATLADFVPPVRHSRHVRNGKGRELRRTARQLERRSRAGGLHGQWRQPRGQRRGQPHELVQRARLPLDDDLHGRHALAAAHFQRLQHRGQLRLSLPIRRRQRRRRPRDRSPRQLTARGLHSVWERRNRALHVRWLCQRRRLHGHVRVRRRQHRSSSPPGSVHRGRHQPRRQRRCLPRVARQSARMPLDDELYGHDSLAAAHFQRLQHRGWVRLSVPVRRRQF